MQTEILITNILNTKTAFGIISDTHESVFIPSKVATAAAIKVGQTVNAMIVPNSNQPDKTPWMAIFIPASNDLDDLQKEILADLEDGPATAIEVAASIGQDLAIVARKMREMQRDGVIVQEYVYALDKEDFAVDREEA